MVACDQLFEEVERPEFIVAMSYGRTGKFTLPKQDGVQRRVMKLGKENVEHIKAMFVVWFLGNNMFFAHVFHVKGSGGKD